MADDKLISGESAPAGDEPRTGPAEPVAPQQSSQPRNPLRPSRTSGLWLAVVALGVLMVLLVIFIVQNTQRVEVSFLGWDGRTPLSVALLVAASAGLLLSAIAGTLRIWQLRRRFKRSV